MSFVADSSNTPRDHNLRDCQGQKLQTSGTKDAELIVDDILNGQAVLKQQFIVVLARWGSHKLFAISWTDDEERLDNW